jgi:hypothetical protein
LPVIRLYVFHVHRVFLYGKIGLKSIVFNKNPKLLDFKEL